MKFTSVALLVTFLLMAGCGRSKSTYQLRAGTSNNGGNNGDNDAAVVYTDTIVCTKTSFFPTYGVKERKQLTFSQGECEGKLPDSSFVGMLAATKICGLSDSYQVIQPWETKGPGIDFRAVDGCASPKTVATDPSLLRVVFRKLPAGYTGKAGGFAAVPTGGTTGVIVCEKTNFQPSTTSSGYGLSFTAAECGGVQPTIGYKGALAKADTCGAEYSVTVGNPSPGFGGGISLNVPASPECGSASGPSALQVVFQRDNDASRLRSCVKTQITLTYQDYPNFATGAGNMNFAISAAECGGVLPASNFVGVLSHLTMLGVARSHVLKQPSEGGPALSLFHIDGWGMGPTATYPVAVYDNLALGGLYFPR